MTRAWTKLTRDKRGAVAPTVALSLVALIATGGIAFDYARLATLDSELQNAADQAALAGASQLDGQTGAVARAVAAAQSLLVNQTLTGNDGGGMTIQTGTTTGSGASTVARIYFYTTKQNAEDDTSPILDSAAVDATAKYIKVAVVGRQAKYALTPIVGAISSSTIGAEAVAGLSSAICKVPPVMMCNPDEPAGNTVVNYAFNGNGYAGRGLRLISVGNGNSAWGPGDFGYLDTGSPTSNPNVELRQALGWLTAPGDCSPVDGVKTRTGAGTTVTQAINTRFDIYEKVQNNNANANFNGGNASCPSGGSCPPSINTVKDLIQKGAPTTANKCGIANNEWEEPTTPYRPPSTTDLTIAQMPTAMGHPRDKCHALSINGSCVGGKIGDGAWDRGAYFYVNYGWTAAQWPTFIATGLSPVTSTTPSRYQVYLWEIANRGTVVGGKTILPTSRQYGSGGNPPTAFNQPVCSAFQTPATTGIVPGGTNVDRRRISTAVLNCSAYNVHGGGGTVYPVLKFLEMFLVEPSTKRGSVTDANDVYVEIIGETTAGGSNTAGQVVKRDVPYLIR